MDTLTEHKLLLIHPGVWWEQWRCGRGIRPVALLACSSQTGWHCPHWYIQTSPTKHQQAKPTEPHILILTPWPKPPVNPFHQPALVLTSPRWVLSPPWAWPTHGNSLFPWCFLLSIYLWSYPLLPGSSTPSCLFPKVPLSIKLSASMGLTEEAPKTEDLAGNGHFMGFCCPITVRRQAPWRNLSFWVFLLGLQSVMSFTAFYQKRLKTRQPWDLAGLWGQFGFPQGLLLLFPHQYGMLQYPGFLPALINCLEEYGKVIMIKESGWCLHRT